MKKSFKRKIVTLAIMLMAFNSFACECYCEGDCSFRAVSNNNKFVALVKVIEYSDFLDYDIDDYDQEMPFSMTVEIIKKYKGDEVKNRIKIWGDNGILCRPYIANFEIGKYYLISPRQIGSDSENGNKEDYDFFACWTDYLTVDFDNGIVYGEYTKLKSEISLEEFENEFEK
ncbi:hypothetical protein KXJ69_00845 [Aureisphaera sp. CAU 1614]|uniref:Tissue inhibitor of metalloproteinase n=1 Tax=Halomarinibacterium sedimenti TaxID=2857106 RepID=A0A9X1JYV9_9FLAO|nr:hypothetical protein [Halomarinibacterium sedimenti]MBW2936631.1 hypothetical protein [Halomarinibacterium sedimenti]